MSGQRRTYTLKGSALPHALMITLLVVGSLSAMLLIYSQHKLFLDRLYFEELAQDNLESGLFYVLETEEVPIGHFEDALFDSSIDSFSVDAEAWGMYGVANCTGKHGPKKVAKTVMFAQRPMGGFQDNLILKHGRNRLKLAGEASLSGSLFVPEGRLERGNLHGLPFTGKRLYQGALQSSKGRNLNWDYTALEPVLDYLERPLIPNQKLQSGDSIHQNWDEEALIVGESGTVWLDEVRLSGKIIVVGDEVVIPASARLEDVLVVARQIEVDHGFSGRCQLFARDSVYVGMDAELLFPSSIGVFSDVGRGYLVLDSGASVQGTVMNDPISWEGTRREGSYSLIQDQVEINGYLLVRNGLDLRGTVQGSVQTEEMIYRGAGSTRMNHLVGGKVQAFEEKPVGAGLLQRGKPGHFIIRNGL